MSQPTTEVLIVGAGPTGLMLACNLLRRDVPFRIIDRAESPSTSSRAVNIQARTLEALDELGVLEDFFSNGRTIEAVQNYSGRKPTERFEVNSKPVPEIPYPYLLVLEQHVTEQILARYLSTRNVYVERGVELRSLTNDPDQVKALLAGPDGEIHLRCAYVVGCDGANSTVRRLARIEMESVQTSVAFRLADVEVDWELPIDEVLRFVEEESELLAIPLPGVNRYRLSHWETLSDNWTEKDTTPGNPDDAPSSEYVEKLLEALVPGKAELIELRSSVSYRTGLGMASTLFHERVLLAGDSGHLTPQCSSQGMNLGLQDAYNLGWKLGLVVKGDAPRELLESYKSEREECARGVLRTTSFQPSRLGRANQFANREALDSWSQLGLHYRSSPLSLTSTSHRVRAGDRAPDGELAIGGRVTSLYATLDGLNHHLLAFSDQESAELEAFLKKVEELYSPMVCIHRIGLGPNSDMDLNRRLHRAFTAEHGDMVLVRPDRFIGANVNFRERQALLGHLAGYLIPRALA